MIEKAKFIVMQSFRAGSDSKVLICFHQNNVTQKKIEMGKLSPKKE